MHTIDRDELDRALRSGTDVRLVCTLSAWGFGTGHIPGSLHLPTPEHARVALAVDADVVVYGLDERDPSAPAAARYLLRHGFTRVRLYPGGIADWSAAGLTLDGSPTRGA